MSTGAANWGWLKGSSGRGPAHQTNYGAKCCQLHFLQARRRKQTSGSIFDFFRKGQTNIFAAKPQTTRHPAYKVPALPSHLSQHSMSAARDRSAIKFIIQNKRFSKHTKTGRERLSTSVEYGLDQCSLMKKYCDKSFSQLNFLLFWQSRARGAYKKRIAFIIGTFASFLSIWPVPWALVRR